jgi:plastocyanin
MKTKGFFITLALVIILLLGYRFFWQGQKQALAPAARNPQTQGTENQAAGGQSQKSVNPSATSTAAVQYPSEPSAPINAAAPAPQPTFSSGDEVDLGPDVLVVEVDYNGAVFSPAVINIKIGDYVIFKNKSQNDFWPASNPHPTHTDYPEFDAKKPVPPNGKYQFQFQQAGNWGYHDHLNLGATGVVNVSEK